MKIKNIIYGIVLVIGMPVLAVSNGDADNANAEVYEVFADVNKKIDAREYTQADASIQKLKTMAENERYKKLGLDEDIKRKIRSLEGALKFAKKHKHAGGK